MSEETYRKLELEALRLNRSVPEVVAAIPEVEVIPEKVYPYQFPPVPSVEEMMRNLEEIQKRAKERAHLYPPGFELDISRESMYE